MADDLDPFEFSDVHHDSRLVELIGIKGNRMDVFIATNWSRLRSRCCIDLHKDALILSGTQRDLPPGEGRFDGRGRDGAENGIDDPE